MIEYSIQIIQKLTTVGWRFAVLERRNVATRIGSPICPPARWMAKNTDVRFRKSGGGGGSALASQSVSMSLSHHASGRCQLGTSCVDIVRRTFHTIKYAG